MAERPTACASCGKRLSRKQWYYRNGQFFCKKRCWGTAQEKAKEEQASKAAEKAATGEAAAAPKAEAKKAA